MKLRFTKKQELNRIVILIFLIILLGIGYSI